MSKNEKLDKCDFCAYRDEFGNCTGEVGSEACDTAGWRFMEYMKAIANNNRTNNINVNKKSHNVNKNYNYNKNKRRR